MQLREIAEKKIRLNENLGWRCNNISKYQPVEDTDINDDQAVPLNEDASNISFDNFEKENAAEKERKTYLTQNEIQKLIDKRKDDVNIENVSDEDLSLIVEDEIKRKRSPNKLFIYPKKNIFKIILVYHNIN